MKEQLCACCGLLKSIFFCECAFSSFHEINTTFISLILETPPPAYMSEDGGSPRPDPNSMETGDTVPPGMFLVYHLSPPFE